MDMRCTLCMDRLARGVLTGKNGRPACNAFTAGCVWFKKDQVERHFEILHSNDSTSKVVMGPLEKSLYTSIEMEEKRVKMIFKECYNISSHYGALNEIKDRCLFTALQTGFYIGKTCANPNMAREMILCIACVLRAGLIGTIYLSTWFALMLDESY